MRYIVSLLTAVGIATLAFMAAGPPAALAAFHCMRIHAVTAGLNGNNNIQYVELRMDTGGQTFVGTHQIKFYSGDPSIATNLKATFTFPANVMTNGSTGDSILIATQDFANVATGGAPDFIFKAAPDPQANTVGANGGDPLHPIQAPNGFVHFAPGNDNCDADFVAGAGEVDSVGYGTTPAFFGSPATALPSPNTNGVLRVNNLNTTPSNNSAEYAINTVSATTFSVPAGNIVTDLTTPRNNARTVLLVPNTGPVGGVSQDPQSLPALDATSSGGGSSGWWIYALAGGAAAMIAAGSAGFVWRRRARRL